MAGIRLFIILLFAPFLCLGQVYKYGSNGVLAYPAFKNNSGYPLPGWGYRLDKASFQYFNYADSGEFDIANTDITISVTCAIDDPDAVEYIFGKPSNASISGRYAIAFLANDDVRWYVQDDAAIRYKDFSGYADNNEHTFILSVEKSDKVRFYIDNTKVDSLDISSYTYTEMAGVYNLIVGGNINGSTGNRQDFANVDVHDVRFFKRAITDDEALQIYNNNAIGDEYGWWIMHPNAVYDASGNGNNMTRINFDANVYITGTWVNYLTKYGYTDTDSIPFNCTTIDNFGTAKRDINGTDLLRYILKQ